MEGERAYFVSASLFRLSKLWPVSAPLSLAFIKPRDCRVGKTGSRSYYQSATCPSCGCGVCDEKSRMTYCCPRHVCGPPILSIQLILRL